MTGWDLPAAAELDGVPYAVNADYRDVLDIISRLNDPDEDEQTRLYVALALFYENFEEMPERKYLEAAKWMFCFMNGGEEESKSGPTHKTIDWEQDKAMIVADINKVAGCEVRALPFCHWWTFLAWFKGIGDGQLATVVSIREKRRKGKKLSDWEREFYQENRALVDFQRKYTKEELEEREQLEKLLRG